MGLTKENHCISLVSWVIWALVAVLAVGPTVLDTTPGANAYLYEIKEANTTYDEWTDIFTMVYPLDPLINVTDQLRVEIFDMNCDYPQLGVPNGLISDYINASGYHIFEVDPHTMSFDPRLFNYSYWANTTLQNAVIKLCVRAELWTGPESDPDAHEMNSLETIVTLFIDLQEDFYIDNFNVEKRDNLTNFGIEEESFEVFAYFCDPITQEKTDPNPIRQGQLVTVCVEITEFALKKGVYIDYIDEFTWIRNNTYSSDIVQEVIQNAALVNPLISIYDCVSPLIVCDFSMIMYADFFKETGTAYGVGMAHLTFAPPEADGSRNLQQLTQQQQQEYQYHEKRNWPSRTLQEIPDTGTFQLDLRVAKNEAVRPLLKTAGGVPSPRTRTSWTHVSAFVASLLLLGC